MKQKLRAVIIGCGNIAGGYDSKAAKNDKATRTHAKAYTNNRSVEIVGAYDPNKDTGESFCKRWNIPFLADSLPELLQKSTPDIVSICSPNDSHFEIFNIVAGLKPRAIICEKPMAMSLEEAEKMHHLAKENGIALVVNYMRRWDRELGLLGKRINSGEFGKCQTGKVVYTKGVFHNASHGINLLEKWLGEFKYAKIQRVLKRTQNPKSDLLAHFSLTFENGEDIFFQGLNADNYNHFEIELFMEKAKIQLPSGGSSIIIDWAQESTTVPQMRTLGKIEKTPGTLDFSIQEVIDNVISHILEKTPLKMEPQEAVTTISICDQIRKESLCLN